MMRLFAFAVTIILFVSCNSRHVENLLNDVETYISERPDSALAVLDSIDRDLLTTRKLRSHHALLHAMALDKNYIDVSDDSLALTALDFYGSRGDKKYKARSLYYLGLSYYYSQEYDKAIIEFTKAEEVAQRHDSLYWGMTKVAQADTYAHTYNEIEEINCLRKSLEINKDLKNEYYFQAAKFRLASALYDGGFYYESDSLLNELIYNENIYDVVKHRALITYAHMNAIVYKDYIASSDLYNRVHDDYCNDLLDFQHYWVWAYSLNKSGKEKLSEELISQLTCIDTTISSEYWQYIFAKDYSDHKKALHHLERTVEKNEIEIEKALKQELSLKQRDYHASLSELILYKMRNRTILLTFAIIFILMITGYLVIFYRGYIKKQQEEKEKYMEYVAEITRQLDSVKNDDQDSLKKKYIGLYKSKFEVLRLLSDQYLLTENRVDAEDKMYRKVVSLVNEIRNDEENRAKFEAMLDNDLDMIMTHIRTEMPKMKELDYAIFRYLIVGFDATTISRLMDITVNNVYAHKRRIRIKIEEKHPEHATQFLEMLAG